MPNPSVRTQQLALDSLQPPPLDHAERAEGIRPRYFLHANGTGLQMSTPKFEVVCQACQEWTWAHGRHCMMCGAALQLSEHHQTVLRLNQHQAHVQGAPRQAFRSPPQEASQRPQEAAQGPSESGSFNNPSWAAGGLTGPSRGHLLTPPSGEGQTPA